MIIPDLAKRVAWYQTHLQPEDPNQGPGIASWTITAEYMPGAELAAKYGSPIWGCMGSPASGGMLMLTPEDIAARRAHIVVTLPEKPADLAQVDRTLIHECGHILVAHLALPRADEENIMHSVDNLFSKLTPDEGIALARAIHDPAARAYRAQEGSMPEVADDKKDKPEPAKAQDGAPRDVATIEVELAKAQMSGQPIEALALELALALVARGAAGGAEPASVPPPPPPAMGMKPEDAYARQVAASTKEALEALVEAHVITDAKQKSAILNCGSIARAREILSAFPRNITAPQMGLGGHPSTPAGGGKVEKKNVFKPSGDAASMARARVDADPDEELPAIEAPGCTKFSAERIQSEGKLMEMSHWKAWRHIRKNADANTARARARMPGGAQ